MAETLRILVVDDDSEAADSLAELFEMEGHEVTVAYDGNAAIEAYREQDFDIAFMDIMMPGKNGVESFFEIRKLRPEAKVYMMTGFSVEQLIQQAIAHGAMGILSKPVDLNKVLGMLDDVKPAGMILVAEDDPDFGPQLCEVITASGYTCKLARDGREAIEFAANNRVEVMILDLKLPVVDGIEVYSALKDKGAAIPTIVITGHAADYPDMISAMRDVQVTGVLNKPFDPGMLLDQLENLTGRKEAA